MEEVGPEEYYKLMFFMGAFLIVFEFLIYYGTAMALVGVGFIAAGVVLYILPTDNILVLLAFFLAFPTAVVIQFKKRFYDWQIKLYPYHMTLIGKNVELHDYFALSGERAKVLWKKRNIVLNAEILISRGEELKFYKGDKIRVVRVEGGYAHCVPIAACTDYKPEEDTNKGGRSEKKEEA